MTSNINFNEWVIKNPTYTDCYEPFYEESDLVFILKELKDEERIEFIRLEEKQNPVQFKKFREDYPEFFE